jgi:hypothetical protein
VQRIRSELAKWRERFRQPHDPIHESAPRWARRKTALAITTPVFVLLEFAATPLVGFTVSAAAGALTALALVGLTFLGSLVMAPIAQRNDLRTQVVGRAGDLSFTEWLESVRWKLDLPMGPNGRIFEVTTHSVAWIWVTNNGPTASFAAEIRAVAGVPSDWGDYFVAEAAWDQKNSATIEIPHGGRRKLKVATIAEFPQHGFWFWTTESQREEPGWQWWMGDRDTADVRFEVVMTNTATNQTAARWARIQIPRDVDDSSFELEE